MKYDFLVLGSSGLQGRIVVKDLLESGYKVSCADLYREGSEKNLSEFPGLSFTFIDLRNFDKAKKVIGKVQTNTVVNCAEGDWNHDVYRICLELGRNVIDLGSSITMTKAQLGMHLDFVKKGLTALTGCGSTPGVNNIMFRHGIAGYEKIDTVELGFAWDSNVKKFVVPFSIESVIEELTELAPVLEDGKWVEKKPFDTEVQREFREIGTQKCYLVTHPETHTFHTEYAKKYGIRNIRFYAGFPDHCLDMLHHIIELGLGAKDLLHFEKADIRPVDALSRILTRLPRPDGYMERENLWVEISGHDKQGNVKITKMECLVTTIPGWEHAGSNIDTGIPASIMAQMVLDGRVAKKGSFTPDQVVPVESFFEELKKKGMTVFQDGVAISS